MNVAQAMQAPGAAVKNLGTNVKSFFVGKEEREMTDLEMMARIMNTKAGRKTIAQRKKAKRIKKLKRRLAVVAVIALWLGSATVFYKQNNDWTLAQGFFFAVDVGFGVGFGSLVEGEGNILEPEYEAWQGSMAFTLIHTLLGAMLVSLALAYFITLMLELQERIAEEEAIEKKEVRKSFSKRVTEFVARNSMFCLALSMWLLFIIVGTAVSVYLADFSFVQGLYFSITTMSTGGLQGPDPNNRDQLYFWGWYTLLGVPCMAIVVAQLSGLFVEKWEKERQLAKLNGEVTEAEFRFAANLLKDGSDITFKEFLIMTLMKLGRLDEKMLNNIKERFELLDVNNDGCFSKAEMHSMLEFERYDLDNSGELDLVEFTLLLSDLEEQFPGIISADSESVMREFRKIDETCDGSIDKVEFLEWYRNNKKVFDETREARHKEPKNRAGPHREEEDEKKKKHTNSDKKKRKNSKHRDAKNQERKKKGKDDKHQK